MSACVHAPLLFSFVWWVLHVTQDDQGFGDSSYNCQNSSGMCARTPNLDALALSPHSALFSRFYAAAGVCSPTRAAYLTGRTNERDCIHFALNCDSEDPADGCSQGKGLPWSEFTTAKAAKVCSFFFGGCTAARVAVCMSTLYRLRGAIDWIA